MKKNVSRVINVAQHVINKCGGAYIVAGWLDVTTNTVTRMMLPKERKGTGGIIPAQHQRILLEMAWKNGVDLKPWELVDCPTTNSGERLLSLQDYVKVV